MSLALSSLWCVPICASKARVKLTSEAVFSWKGKRQQVSWALSVVLNTSLSGGWAPRIEAEVVCGYYKALLAWGGHSLRLLGKLLPQSTIQSKTPSCTENTA